MKRYEDLSDTRFGLLTPIKYMGDKRWLCKCDCGEEKSIATKHLKSGGTQSCGCLRDRLVKERRKLPDGEASFNHLYSSYRRGAKIRNLVFNIPKERFRELINMSCEYCGSPPERLHFSKGSSTSYTCNGIDRVDNSVGYTIENSVACCKMCNIAKGDSTLSKFKEWVKRLVVFNNKE